MHVWEQRRYTFEENAPEWRNGRRGGLKNRWGCTPCGFESLLRHQGTDPEFGRSGSRSALAAKPLPIVLLAASAASVAAASRASPGVTWLSVSSVTETVLWPKRLATTFGRIPLTQAQTRRGVPEVGEADPWLPRPLEQPLEAWRHLWHTRSPQPRSCTRPTIGSTPAVWSRLPSSDSLPITSTLSSSATT